MRTLKLLLLFAVGLLAYACESKSDAPVEPGKNPHITITSETSLWFDGEGGEGVISYTIENGRDNLQLKAVSNVDWITNIVVGDTVSYVVEKNADDEERRGAIELSYGDEQCRVTIMQHTAIDDVFEATTLSGSCYYDGDGIYNYYVVLSTVGVSEDGYLIANAQYYYFDLYSSVPASGDSARIPNGTYELSWSEEPTDGMIYYEYSCLTTTSDYDYIDTMFSSAELTVSDNCIIATVEFATGERVRVQYSGSLDIPIYSSTVTEGLSTLTGDYSFDIEDGLFVGAYIGDLMYTGCNTCQVYMFEHLDLETGEESGDVFQIDLQLPVGGTDICGTYTEGYDEGCFIPGSAEDIGGQLMQQNSWYMTADYFNFAPLVSGTVVIEKDDTDLYTFTIDTVDDLGNSIKGTFRGSGEFTEW